jgi:magnesium transporter
MISYYLRTRREPTLLTLPDFAKGAWIAVEEPTDAELDLAAERFSLDRGLLADAVDPFEVPRAESSGGVAYAFTRVPERSGGEDATAPLLVAVGPDFVLTVSRTRLALFDPFREARLDFYSTQKLKFFLQIFFEIIRAYTRVLTAVSRQVRAASVNVQRVGPADILRFVRFEGTVNDFLSALVPTDALLRSVLSGRFFALYEADKELVEDLLLATGQLLEQGKSTLRTIVNIREAYATVATHSLNRVLKLLAALTIVLTIPTMIASFFGMNVPVPFADSPRAFVWIVAWAGVASLAALAALYRKEWL